MKILLSYLELDTLHDMEYNLDLGLSYEIDLHPKRQHRNFRRPNAIRRRIGLVRAELDGRNHDK
jgi:hypothetical protein